MTTYAEKFLEFVEQNDVNLMERVKPNNAEKVKALRPVSESEADRFSRLISKGYSSEQILADIELGFIMEKLKPEQFEVYKENLELAREVYVSQSDAKCFVDVITLYPETKENAELLRHILKAMYEDCNEQLGALVALAKKMQEAGLIHLLSDLTNATYDKDFFEVLTRWPISAKTPIRWMFQTLVGENRFGYGRNVALKEGRMMKLLNVALLHEKPEDVLTYIKENNGYRLFQLDKLAMKIEKGYFNLEEDFVQQVYGSKYAEILNQEKISSVKYAFVEEIIKDKKASKLYEGICAALNKKQENIYYTNEALVELMMIRLKDVVSKIKWNAASETDIEWLIYNSDDVGKVMETYEDEEKLEASYVVSLTKIVMKVYKHSTYDMNKHNFFAVKEEHQPLLKRLVLNSPYFLLDFGSELQDKKELKKVLENFGKFEHTLPPALLKEAAELDNDEKYKIKDYYELELLKQYPGATIEQARKLNVRGSSFKTVKALVEDGVMDDVEQGYIEELAQKGFFNIINSLLNRSQREEYKLLAKAVLLDKFEALKYPKGDLEKELEIAIDEKVESEWKTNTSKKSTDYKALETDDFISLITIGNAPIETCLNSSTGSHKFAALSMMDSNKKLLKVYYKGNYALRSVLRLCKIADNAPVQKPLEFMDVESIDENGIVEEALNERVALFLEMPYTYLDVEQKKGAMKQLITLAKEKAKMMNCELVLSTPYGELVKQKEQRVCVHISKSKNGVQYLDSLQGQYAENAFGFYAEGNFVVIKP